MMNEAKCVCIDLKCQMNCQRHKRLLLVYDASQENALMYAKNGFDNGNEEAAMLNEILSFSDCKTVCDANSDGGVR